MNTHDVCFTATRLYENVWMIEEPYVRCFLFVGFEKAVLVDCCMNAHEQFSELVHSLTDLPIELMLTHGDRDHIGGQRFFHTLWMHPAEYDYYRSKDNSTTEITPLWEGLEIDMGNTQLEVILLPGHTPGSIALLDRKQRALYIGDTVQSGPIHMFGPGRNLDALIASLKKLEGMSDAFEVIHASHGEISLGAEWIAKTKAAAELLQAGKLEGTQAPEELNLPCKIYKHKDVTLLY